MLDLAAGTGRLTRELAEPLRARSSRSSPTSGCGRCTRRRSAGSGGGDPARRRECRRGLRRRGLPLVRRARRDRRDRTRAAPARRARDRLDALVGDGAAPARARHWSCCASLGSASPRSATRPGTTLRRLAVRAAAATSGSRRRSSSIPDELLELYSTTSSLAAISREERAALLRRGAAAAGRRRTACRSSTSSPGRASHELELQLGRRKVRRHASGPRALPGDGVTKGDLAAYYAESRPRSSASARPPVHAQALSARIRTRPTSTSRRRRASRPGSRPGSSAPGRARASRGSSTSRS